VQRVSLVCLWHSNFVCKCKIVYSDDNITQLTMYDVMDSEWWIGNDMT